MSLTPLEPNGSALAAVVSSARAQLRADLVGGARGRTAIQRFTDRMDVVVRRLFDTAPAPASPVAVIALGGYGRRQLCPYSDIDILLLFADSIAASEEALVRALLHPLWDLGLVVGHQVRELADFETLERDNGEFLLALLDARLIAGARALFEAFRLHFHTAETHAFVLTELQQLIEERHAPFNGTFYQLEPDLKDAPGALRDVAAARALAQVTDPHLLTRGPAEPSRLDEAEEFLLIVRALLHADCGRNHNVLSHEQQERMAEELSYAGATPRQRVERLMSDYFRHARVVSRSLEWARRAAPVPVGPNVGLSRDGVGFLDPMGAASAPASWIGAFRAAIDAGAAVSEDSLSLIRRHLDRYATLELSMDGGHREALLRLLKPRPGLYAQLSDMHECGLLVRVFPEFQAISGRVVRDFYHKYTVDEHTLLTIRSLERLLTTDDPNRQRLRSMLENLASPELLVLALLFHDVGKWRDDEHALESARMAEGALDRLQLEPDDRATVLFLIEHHLRMSVAAFRRDTDEPTIVSEFAARVGSEERLQMLCVMTLADIEAVGVGTLTPWKEELLWRLYVDTYNHLTQRYADEVIEPNYVELTALLASRPDDLPAADIIQFVEGLPRRYFQMFPQEVIYRHVRLARDIHAGQAHVSLEQTDTVWTLVVAALDQPFLFSSICGVAASFGMNILRGHALTNANGLVLDVFQFSDDNRFLTLNGQDPVVETLQAVVAGQLDVATLLRGHEQGIFRRTGPARFAPTIRIDSDASQRYTILDIVADNALGLLHRISRVISEHACDVHVVLIATEGDKAIDVFHITKTGAKLTEPEQRALTSALQQTLERTS